jgi:hypothetical protein
MGNEFFENVNKIRMYWKDFNNNKPGIIRKNVTLRCVRVTIVAVEKQ